MESTGIMGQVRGLLSQGLRSSEIIAQGYAASTVYGVQRKLRKQQGLLGNGFLPGPNGQGYQSRMASENRWLRKRVEALEDRTAEGSGHSDGSPLLQRLEDLESQLAQLLARQKQIVQAVGQVQGWADRVDGELDDLALMYQQELWFGVGEPKWKRRPSEAGEYVPEPRSLGPGIN